MHFSCKKPYQFKLNLEFKVITNVTQEINVDVSNLPTINRAVT